jgi:hypothetical protein
MATFPAAPTYAEPVVVDEISGKPKFNPIWLRWFLQIQSFISQSGGGGGGAADHNSLTGLQGGQVNEYYHLTAAELALATSPWPIVLNSVPVGETCTIPVGYQLIVSGSFDVDGTLEADGELVII